MTAVLSFYGNLGTCNVFREACNNDMEIFLCSCEGEILGEALVVPEDELLVSKSQ